MIKTKNRYVLLLVSILWSYIQPMGNRELRPQTLTSDIAQLLACSLVDSLKTIDRYSRNNLFKLLQRLSQTSKGARNIKILLFGNDPQAQAFNYYLKLHFMKYVVFQTPSEFMLYNSLESRKEYIALAYIGTPFALEMLRNFLMYAQPYRIKYNFDARKITRSVEKYRYLDATGKKQNCIEANEPLDQTLSKFPLSTQYFVQEILAQRGLD